MARPPKSDIEKSVSVSIRIPPALYTEVHACAQLRRTTITALVLEGLRLCLDTPIDPREVPVSQSMTAIQELEQLIDARVYAILATERQREPAPQPEQPIATLSYGERKTVIQMQEEGESTQDCNAVIREEAAGDLDYDPTRYVLGPLCQHGHDYQGTGQSLRRRRNRECVECKTIRERDRKRQLRQRN